MTTLFVYEDMRLLRDVVVQVRKRKNEVDANNDKAIVKSVMVKIQLGSLLQRDTTIATNINDHIWGEGNLEEDGDDEATLRSKIEAAQDDLGIHLHDWLVKKTDSLRNSLERFRATILCGPSMSGKSTLLKV